MSSSSSRTRKYSAEEKEQLLANLDLEVSHKTRQFEEWLTDVLENFRRHQESLILRMPRIVRDMTLREFVKYNGDIQAAVKGRNRELLGNEDATIDLGTRKRKWVESQESEEKAAKGQQEVEGSRGIKNARMVAATPKKKPAPPLAPSTAQKSRLPITKTPAKTRIVSRVPSGAVSPSPQKGASKPLGFPRTPSRFASPAKPSQATRPASRVPSTSTFNPVLPSEANHPRWPRKNEHMLSVNGSPLANPYQLDLKNWFKAVAEADPDAPDGTGPGKGKGAGAGGGKTLKKQRSIIVRSASSSSHLGVSGSSSQGGHSRSASQATLVESDSQPTNTWKGSTVIERASSSLEDPFIGPSFSALVSVQTRDGHVLEFNPLKTSPEELDALEGITDSAKKQAKEDMARLIQGALERWKLS
ncbi:hypothetical protein L226DRAFT_482837 [Lentinus tigrinus ALCF2SS1-7]|uniref:Uncharacterized protein n=1 Tax=Lentinus tigrinus ALCF2SS1-6 TaxID=1328759 RepID=A0A5C2SEJ1_9APHY|nr:hypothetical protein L227DRAFT_573445 [Lentinus tigrinus ALCF2SS1-6]RPD77990.1 hypothetical protein L226DRAFT_482837 [Lentinus tigrinus ALCF2SS1-7]